MSDSGESNTMSDTGESRCTSEAGDSSVLSDWSMVDSHGELPDDETASTSSSVEVVDESYDDSSVEPATPVAGSPNVIAPRFILRLPSQNQDGSDTEEEKQESATHSDIQGKVKTNNSAHLKRSPETRLSREEIEEFRQTIENLKKNLLPSQADDNLVSSIELFRDSKSDENNMNTDNLLLPERTVENIGNQDNKIDGRLSLDSSISSSYSFLARDPGTDCCTLGDTSGLGDSHNGTRNQADLNREDTSDLNEMQGTSNQTNTDNLPVEEGTNESEIPCDTKEAITEQETITSENQSGDGLKQFISQFFKSPVKYVFLAGLVVYTGVIIITVYSLQRQGQGDSKELGILHTSHNKMEQMQIKLETCDKDILDSKALIKSSSQKLEELTKEKNAVLVQLEGKEKEVLKLQDNVNVLVKENERITQSEHDLLRQEKELIAKIKRLQNQADESTSDQAHTKQFLEKCLRESAEIKLQKMDIENSKYKSDEDLSTEQKKCQTDIDYLRSQYQSEIDNVRKQYQSDLDGVRKQYRSDLDRVRGQYQSDLDKLKNEYQSNLDSLTLHMNAKNKYTQSENTENEKCDKNGDNCGVDNDMTHSDESYTTNFQSEKQRSNQRKKKHSEGKRSSRTGNSNSRGDNSDDNSNKGDDYGSYWAEKIVDIMNKTREQIQDTWFKVKDMSESFWHEHQPTLYRLHDSFTKKFEHLSTRFQNKLSKKLKKWYGKGREYTQQWRNGPQASTKRRPYQSEDDASNSNRSVEDRLVKLSHQVQELNAQKFRKLRDTQKVLKIQEEFKQVNEHVNKDDGQRERNKLTEWYLKWLSCQFQWWQNLDVAKVTDDCYLSLCCWQFKVTDGTGRHCRKAKRKLGRVEDTCTLEPIEQMKTSDGKCHKKKHGLANNHKIIDLEVHYSQDKNDGNVRKEPANGKEDNWFLARGEDREYFREEPDNWYFRRQNKQNEQTRLTSDHSDVIKDDEYVSDDVDDDIVDDDYDDEPYYYDDIDISKEYCNSHHIDCGNIYMSGHCGCP